MVTRASACVLVIHIHSFIFGNTAVLALSNDLTPSSLDCSNSSQPIKGGDKYMRVNTRTLLAATAVMLAVVIPSATWAQHKHTQSTQKKSGMGMSPEMAKMMKSPHHVLMTAHMNSMSEFARALRDQAVKPESLDVEFARAAVAELRHSLDAMEAIHQKHMQGMN